MMADHPSSERLSNSSIDHNINEVWTAVRRQGESVAEIRQGLASIVDTLADFRTELRNIRDITTRPSQPTNWLGVASLCVAILIAGGSYATSVISPVKEDSKAAIAWQVDRSKSLIEDYRVFGAIGELVDSNNESIVRLDAHAKESDVQLARLSGIIEMMREQLTIVGTNRRGGKNHEKEMQR